MHRSQSFVSRKFDRHVWDVFEQSRRVPRKQTSPAGSFRDCPRGSKDVRVYSSLHGSNTNRGGYFDQGGTQGADTASHESSLGDGVVGISFQQFLRGAVESKVSADSKSSSTRGTEHAFIKHGKLFADG